MLTQRGAAGSTVRCRGMYSRLARARRAEHQDCAGGAITARLALLAAHVGVVVIVV